MNIEEQVTYLMQGTEYGDETLKKTMTDELRQRLLEAHRENRPLRVYCGYDPTKADLHLGHTVTMRKLQQFQELGHEVTFLIGNYTSLIGDPSDKNVLRPQLTPEEVEANARTYAEQAFRILDPKKTLVRYNAEWLSKLTFAELIKLASNFTIQQFLGRENFRLRWEKGDAVFLHETFYSIMQGYDAYAMRSDVQVGGTDQLFNIITAARKVMAFLGEKPNIGIILGILPGTDGVIRMSKSLGNHIPITTDAIDMYGKVMSIPDIAMPTYFRLVTRWTPEKIDSLEKELQNGQHNPRDVKKELAFEIVSSFYGDLDANNAQDDFVQRFQQGGKPKQIDNFPVIFPLEILDIMINAKLAASRNEGKRLINQKSVRFDDLLVIDPAMKIEKPGILQVGKRNFLRIVLKG